MSPYRVYIYINNEETLKIDSFVFVLAENKDNGTV